MFSVVTCSRYLLSLELGNPPALPNILQRCTLTARPVSSPVSAAERRTELVGVRRPHRRGAHSWLISFTLSGLIKKLDVSRELNYNL